MEQKFTNLVIRIPVFKNGEITNQYMDFISMETRTLSELVTELREVFKEAGITHIKTRELQSFILNHGVWYEMDVQVFDKNGTELKDTTFGEALKGHKEYLRRETIKIGTDEKPCLDGMMNLGNKNPSLVAVLEATTKPDVTVAATVMEK